MANRIILSQHQPLSTFFINGQVGGTFLLNSKSQNRLPTKRCNYLFFIFSYRYLMLLLKYVYVLCEDCQLLNPLKEKPPDRLEISPHPHVKEQKSNDEYVCINLESRFLVPCQRLKYYLLSLRFDRESTCCLWMNDQYCWKRPDGPGWNGMWWQVGLPWGGGGGW